MSSKTKIITAGYVHLFDENGSLVTLGPGDAVPEWATVTNPALFEKSDEASGASDATTGSNEANGSTGSGEQTGGQTQTTPPATTGDKGPGLPELRKQAKDLGISAAGNKKELAARIAEKQAEDAKAAAAEDPDGGEDGRAALEAKAKELGIEFDENNSDEELAALIEDKE